jgi:hypothetical protein
MTIGALTSEHEGHKVFYLSSDFIRELRQKLISDGWCAQYVKISPLIKNLDTDKYNGTIGVMRIDRRNFQIIITELAKTIESDDFESYLRENYYIAIKYLKTYLTNVHKS